MTTAYEVSIDPPRKLVNLKLTGQWDLTTVASYARAVGDGFARMKASGVTPGDYLLLVDMRAHGLQVREVTTAYQAFINAHASFVRRRATIVTPSALHELLAKRVAKELDLANGFFRTEQEALDWLFA